jgi:plasmid maintenance system antidote protein VapI
MRWSRPRRRYIQRRWNKLSFRRHILAARILSIAEIKKMSDYMRLFRFSRIAARLGAMSKEQWDRPEDRAEVGERLRLVELATGLNGAEMSRLLGVPTQTWGSWKTGAARIPVHFAARLKGQFGCSMDWLYLGDAHAYHNAPGFRDKLARAREKGPPPRGRGRRVSRLDDLNDGQ